MIGLPKSMTLEKLTFGDLIAHSDAIINSADALKVHGFCAYISRPFCLLYYYYYYYYRNRARGTQTHTRK